MLLRESSRHGQPLIPRDLKQGGRFDGYLVNCFYAPVYMLTTVTSERYYKSQKIKNQTTKSDLQCALFLSMSQDVLRLHWLYGMVLPIPMAMQKRLPALFEILTPSMDGSGNSSDPLEFLDEPKEGFSLADQVKGWSNIALLLCVVSHLVASEKLGISAINPTKHDEMDNLDLLRVEYGVQLFEYMSLEELVQYILFSEEDHLGLNLRKHTRNITKATVYMWLKGQCFYDMPDLRIEEEEEESSEEDDDDDDDDLVVDDVEEEEEKKERQDNNEEEGSHQDGDDNDDNDNDDDDAYSTEKKTRQKQNRKRKKAPKKSTGSNPKRKVQKKDVRTEEKKTKLGKPKVGDVDSDENMATMSKVRDVHPLLPPSYIDVTDIPWYWQLCECDKQQNWPFELSKVEVLSHMKKNIARLLFTWIAKQYAVVQNIQSGVNLMGVLARPAICKKVAEQSVWCQLLNALEARCEVMLTGVVECPNFDIVPRMKINRGTSFSHYFQAVLNESYPEEASEEGMSEDKKTPKDSGSKTTVLTNCCWLPQEVGDMNALTWETVDRKVHALKCKILFDSICYCYFSDFSDPMLTKAVLNHWDVISLRRTPGKKLDWEFDFNVLVWNLKKIDLKPNLAAKNGIHAEKRLLSLAEHCQTRIKDIWSAALEEQADDKQPRPNEQARPGDQVARQGQKEMPGRSLCCELNVVNAGKIDETIGLFFRDQGYMRRDLRWSICFSHPNHGLIRFENFVTTDVRYFIPLVTLSDEEQGKSAAVLSCAAPPLPTLITTLQHQSPIAFLPRQFACWRSQAALI